MSGSNLLVEDLGSIRRFTLNRPEKLNALDSALVEALSEALRHAADDTDVRVIVMAGSGRSFCAGYDLSEESGPGSNLDNLTHSLDRLLEVFDHPRPIIAQVHGHCLAGGLRPDDDVRSGRRLGRCRFRSARDPVRLHRRRPGDALAHRCAASQGADSHRSRPARCVRGASNRPGQPGGPPSRPGKGDDAAGGRIGGRRPGGHDPHQAGLEPIMGGGGLP